MNWNYFIIYISVELILMLIAFIRMSNTNEEEWFYTRYEIGLIIGALPGLIIGTITGTILFNIEGFWLGSSGGIVVGAIAFSLALLAFNLRHREKKEVKEKEKEKKDNNKELLKQLELIKKQIKNS